MGHLWATQRAKSPEEAKCVDDMYRLMEEIGRGSISVVRKGLPWENDSNSEGEQSSKAVAVRVIKRIKGIERGSKGHEALFEELRIQALLRHQNICRIFEVFNEPEAMNITMELLDGGDLHTRIIVRERFEEGEAASVVYGVASALQFMHERGVVFRDLKPENIRFPDPFDSSQPKLVNFSLARDMRRSGDTKGPVGILTPCGSPGYVAPEILHQKIYNEAVDLWSLGVILYTMLCGYPPFYHEKHATLFEIIKAGDYEFHESHWGSVSDPAKHLISRLLCVDPGRRPSASQTVRTTWVYLKRFQYKQHVEEMLKP
ncbi:hypothetical protein AAMO2058_000470100 [Amorphochlora amoebiformis]|uniref:Protein kinase domain-containing protein n=1 Tax=Amorphochlora amoebiformis TaxID=1561963 RepID=A0A7S0DA74_9EUKA|mmetsp:Transcript_21303/g.33614  ORF Transcript_21303/g.33614 Transcript_21303/m.33614 type:complete len:316 (+) Transcript_21303:41-988(+)